MDHFDALCDLDRTAQTAAISELRRADPAMADELATLLAADATDVGAEDLLATQQGLADLVMDATTAPSPDPGQDNDDDRLIGVVVDERYRLTHRIGGGGAGEVYEAVDLESNDTVALKFLRIEAGTSPRSLRRFRREFRAIARLDHPGVLKVYTEGAHGSRRYIAMEYASGGDFNALIGAKPTVLLPLLIQLTSALDHVHRQQIVHRDLKPANVLLTGGASSDVKLADFGIIKETGPRQSTELTVDGAVVGTIDFLAPEQATGDRVDARTDLYALGCMIHVLWTGQAPFQGSTYARLVARVEQAPPLLSAQTSGVPARLDALVNRLLATDPKDRPGSAYAVGLELVAILRELPDVALDDVNDLFGKPVRGAYLYRPGCVGRTDDLSALVSAAHAAVRHADEALEPAALLSGAPGVGKSTLAVAVVEALERDGWRRLVVGVGNDRGAPFAPFPQLLVRLASSVEVDGKALEQPRAHAFGDDGRAQARAVIVRQLVALLDDLCRSSPVVLLLEDLHDASADAITLLAEFVAAVREHQLPAWVLCTSRPHGRERLEQSLPNALSVALEPVDQQGLREIIGRMLGVGASAIPEDLIETINRHTSGSPLLTISAVRGLVEFGVLRRDRDGWDIASSASDDDLTAAITSALTARLHGLAPKTRSLMRLAALLGQRFDIDLLTEVAGQDTDAILDGIDDGLRRGVLQSARTDDGFRFEHDRLRDVLASELDDATRANYHDRIAATLERRGAPPGALARHFGSGTDPRRAVDACQRAGEAAAHANDQALAAAHFRAALARVSELPAGDQQAQAHRLQESLADALVPLGAIDEASGYYRKLENAAGSDRLAAARLMRKHGLALLRTDAAGRGVEMLRRALARLGCTIPKRRWAQMLVTARDLVLGQLGRLLPKRAASPIELERAFIQRELSLLSRWIDLYQAGAHVAAFLRRAERLRVNQFRIDAYAFITFFFALLGSDRISSYFDRRGRRLVEKDTDEVGLIRLELTRGGTDLLVRGDADNAFEQLESAIDRAARLDDAFFSGFANLSGAWAHAMLGQVSQARAAAILAEAQARDAQATWLVADSVLVGAYLDTLFGRLDHASERVSAVLGSEIRYAFPVFEALATEIEAGNAMIQGRYHDAIASYDRSMDLYEKHGLDRGWGFLVAPSYIEALCCIADELGADGIADFHVRLKRCIRWTRRWLAPRQLYVGLLELAKGIAAGRKGDIHKARKLFDKALELRGPETRDYVDVWVHYRIALERSRWGDDRAEVQQRLSHVAAKYDEWSLDGMNAHLQRARRLVDI